MIKEATKDDGTTYLVISLSLRNRKTNAREQFRRAAQVQTRAAAVREERSVIAFWEEHGTIAPLLRTPEKEEAKASKTWKQARERFEEVSCPTFKPSTAKGYKANLKGAHFVAWENLPLTSITPGIVAEWDGLIARSGVKDSTRATLHVVLRSVLRCAVAAGWLPEMPKLPKLPKSGRTVVQAVSPADVHALLYEVDEPNVGKRGPMRVAARRAFAVMSCAGLRASKVRGLRWRDVDLVRGVLTVRHAICAGQEDTPKSGSEREIPITKALRAFLGEPPDVEGAADLFVCTKHDGTPWGDYGIRQALERACQRLGMSSQRAHSLRHSFVTGLFDQGIGAHVVKELAGHASLEVTQRYAHATHASKVAAVAALDAAMANMTNVVRLPSSSTTKKKRATG